MNFKTYTDYIMEKAVQLLNIDSPSGYGKEVTSFVIEELRKYGLKAARRAPQFSKR
ncbi:MAG: hypothetical protein Q4B86_08490 [Eubacteriales bacterium]|nr:hypothetical protein [Eubacteriales bacterium]